ncbi:vesicle-associated protein 2-1-like isoform X1 [Rutidosis leptorrhynchoides]|uniref:vesicle-associated protein 2-1-like isoform X1 n=1 Tax=Rutidosis leptorrhynchoides TaxID=125765 RepID=UPI003A99187B
MASGGKLVSVDPEELRFQFELEKPSHCDLKVSNTTDTNVAFKVKTTSPKKYFVRPNTGVIQPRDSCTIRVTLQAQLEYPPDMQCRDKFLLQSTPVPPNSEDLLELPQNTFTKEPGKQLEEYKLKVVYIARTDKGNADDSLKQSPDLSSNQAIQTAKAARDAAVKEATQVQQELDTLKRRNQKKSPGLSIKLAIAAGIIGLLVGLILKMTLASPSPPLPATAAATE